MCFLYTQQNDIAIATEGQVMFNTVPRMFLNNAGCSHVKKYDQTNINHLTQHHNLLYTKDYSSVVTKLLLKGMLPFMKI